uniref:Uncharacterized protein n=1 Tax=Anguilla anguilla TaxID=7936 RepID=A0A0E9UCG1_ANGAN
MDQTELKAA